MDRYQRRVARGAEHLDGRYPGWLDRLDLGRLDVDDAQRCVIAQVNGLWPSFFMTREGAFGSTRWLARRGFLVPGAVAFLGFLRGGRGSARFRRRHRRLVEAWRAYVIGRRIARLDETGIGIR